MVNFYLNLSQRRRFDVFGSWVEKHKRPKGYDFGKELLPNLRQNPKFKKNLSLGSFMSSGSVQPLYCIAF